MSESMRADAALAARGLAESREKASLGERHVKIQWSHTKMQKTISYLV